MDPQEGRGQASSSPAFIRVDYPAAQAEVGQLTAGALYEVRIRASSSAGPGPLSRPYDVFLGEAGKLSVQDFCLTMRDPEWSKFLHWNELLHTNPGININWYKF